jgi:hypothetical protein
MEMQLAELSSPSVVTGAPAPPSVVPPFVEPSVVEPSVIPLPLVVEPPLVIPLELVVEPPLVIPLELVKLESHPPRLVGAI